MTDLLPCITLPATNAALIAMGKQKTIIQDGPPFQLPKVLKTVGLTVKPGDRIGIHSKAETDADKCPSCRRRTMEWVIDMWRCKACHAEWAVTVDEDPDPDGMFPPLALGCIVATAILEACVPVVTMRQFAQWVNGGEKGSIAIDAALWPVGGTPQEREFIEGPRIVTCTTMHGARTHVFNDFEGEAAFGHWVPGKWIWVLSDVAAVEDRCPVCWGHKDNIEITDHGARFKGCRRCGMDGVTTPIYARGRVGVWPHSFTGAVV